MSGRVAFKCQHCAQKTKIRRSDSDILSNGDIKVVYCENCGAVDQIAITHIQTLVEPSLSSFKALN